MSVSAIGIMTKALVVAKAQSMIFAVLIHLGKPLLLRRTLALVFALAFALGPLTLSFGGNAH